MLKYIIYFFLFFSFSYAQEVGIGADPNDTVVEKKETPTSETQVDYPSTLELNKSERQKVLAVLRKLHPNKSFKELNIILSKQMDEGKVQLTQDQAKELFEVMKDEPDQTLLNKIENLALGTSGGLFAGVEQIRTAFANNPLSLVPKDQVKTTLLKQWEGQKLGQILNDHPKVLEFMASMIIDKQAIPKLLDIFKKQNELKYYGILVILAQIISILAFFTLFKSSSFFKRVFKRTLLFGSINLVLFSYFVWRFYPELEPTIGIMQKVISS